VYYSTTVVPEIFDIVQHTFKAQKFQKLYQPSSCLTDERGEPTQTVPFERACVTHAELSQDQECLLETLEVTCDTEVKYMKYTLNSEYVKIVSQIYDDITLSNSSEDNGMTVLEYNYSVTEMLLDAPLLAFQQLSTTSLQGRKAGPT
jgi:hypothetical protein